MRPAEVAQASLFIAVLETEITELRARIDAAELRWARRRSRSRMPVEAPERLVRLRAELEEAIRLRDSLKKRRTRAASFAPPVSREANAAKPPDD
jgi:hypothetical protein